MDPIEAIYVKGVFQPTGPVALPENTPVTVIPPETINDEIGSNSDDLYALLEERFESGVADAAARIDEHQP